MRLCGVGVLVLTAGLAQQTGFRAQSASTITYGVKDQSATVEITNVSYEIVGQRLVLRKTSRTKQVVDEIGMEASTTVEAWPLGVDPRQKPLYALKAAGVDARTVDGSLLVILR